ncbi:MAG: T9SS type A sorting domain-containing protein [bacterium]|nr:T9SS type A sorting domain-containing protein [bacterium]
MTAILRPRLRIVVPCALLFLATAAGAAPPDWQPAVYDDFPVQVHLADADALSALLARTPVASFNREQVRPLAGGGLEWRPRVTADEAAALTAAGVAWERLPDREQTGRRAVEAAWAARDAAGASVKILTDYPTAAEIGTLLAAIETDHPAIARRFAWGTSVQGRTLWGLAISDDVQNTEPEPEVRLSSTMHGDEPVGMVMLMNLAEYLTDNYGQPGQEALTALVDGTEIHLLPLHNPDGYVAGLRRNANNYDLNRNFEVQASLQPENADFDWYGQTHHFVLSANAHTGALVVNYPWDKTYDRAPDDAALILMSTAYASLNPPMAASPYFPGGITHGADWYPALGTLQDWVYVEHGCLDVTLELSDTKWPAASALAGLWDDNRDSYLAYAATARYGLHGVITDKDTGAPLDATVRLVGNDAEVNTDPTHGDYWKILPTGTWNVRVDAVGYWSYAVDDVATTWGTGTLLDVELEKYVSSVPEAPVIAVRAAPNPFNGGTTVVFTVPADGSVELVVFDLAGRRVKTLVQGFHVAGADSVDWDGRNDAGRSVAAGVYVMRLETPQGRALTKLTYAK